LGGSPRDGRRPGFIDAATRRVDERLVDAERMICCTFRADLLVEVSKLAPEGRFDYLLVESTGIPEPLPVAEPRLGRRTVLTLPLLPPPQKN
jgi:G3E family GTPase